MKIPISLLKKFVSLPKNLKELTDGLTMAGHMLDKTTVTGGETVIDLELRGNRADCYSIFGIAREVSAIFKTKLREPKVVELVKLPSRHVKVNSSLVKRAATIEIKNVKIQKSPRWLSESLKLYGIDSVNNIVDLTNYVMIELGEPMHAFDLERVGPDLEIRLAKNGEKITTFAGTDLILTSDDLVWVSDPEGLRPGGQKIISVAGAIGEKHHSVSDKTKNILLEAANYDRANIRRTVYRHNLLTEAGIRHEKDLDPSMVETAIGRFLYFIKENGWGEFKPEIYDYYPKKVAPWKIKMNIAHFETLAGVKMSLSHIKKILSGLNFQIINSNKIYIECLVPTYRTDVTMEEDLVEEILRIYGYDKIPPATLALEIPDVVTPDFIKEEESLRQAASAAGFDEIISIPFTDEAYSRYNVHPEDLGHKIVTLVNPPSPDIADMRLTLLPNLLKNSRKIINERGKLVSLFEIGKVYSKFKNKYQEERKIGFIYWNDQNHKFTEFKKCIQAFFEKSGLPVPTYLSAPKNPIFSGAYDLTVNRGMIGFGGQIEGMHYAEIDLEKILNKENPYQVSLWPKYPPQIEDITFTLPAKTRIGDLVDTIIKSDKNIKGVVYLDNKTYQNNHTFEITYQNPDKTLTDEEVESMRIKYLKEIKTKFGASLKE